MFLTSSAWFLLLLAAVPVVAFQYFRRKRQAICVQFDLRRCWVTQNPPSATDLGATCTWADCLDAIDRCRCSAPRRSQGDDNRLRRDRHRNGR